MSVTHIVRPGETLSEIAARHGFLNWRAIYEHPQNQELRRKRPNPHLLQIGDEIFIPDRKPKSVQTPTGTHQRFLAHIKRLKTEFELHVLDERTQHPISGFSIELLLPGQVTARRYTTDVKGRIHLAEPDIEAGTVQLVRLRDETELPYLSYPRPANGFSTNQSHQLHLEDKRRAINNVAAKMDIRRRMTWGERSVDYARISEDWGYTTVVVHHSGNSGETDPLQLEEKHMVERHFDDVGYHYLITPDGAIYEGRYLGLRGAHVVNDQNVSINPGKIGILVMGDFEAQWWDADDTPTARQLHSLRALLRTLKDALPTLRFLGGHRDFKDTECPGTALYKHMADLQAASGLAPPGAP